MWQASTTELEGSALPPLCPGAYRSVGVFKAQLGREKCILSARRLLA